MLSNSSHIVCIMLGRVKDFKLISLLRYLYKKKKKKKEDRFNYTFADTRMNTNLFFSLSQLQIGSYEMTEL